jgi:hypothetical protein
LPRVYFNPFFISERSGGGQTLPSDKNRPNMKGGGEGGGRDVYSVYTPGETGLNVGWSEALFEVISNTAAPAICRHPALVDIWG